MKQYAIPVLSRREDMLFTKGDMSDILDTSYTAIRFTLDQLLDNLHAQIDLIECRYGQQARSVLLGTDESRQLFDMRNLPLEYFKIQVPVEAGYLDSRYHRQIMGLDIHHLPWMVGLIVVPQLMDYVSIPNVVNQWSMTTGQHQLIGTGAEKINPDTSLPESQIKDMLGNFKKAFISWAEKPADKPFLREPTWWNKLIHGTKK